MRAQIARTQISPEAIRGLVKLAQEDPQVLAAINGRLNRKKCSTLIKANKHKVKKWDELETIRKRDFESIE